MKNFSVKNINFVGAGAALLAFIFTFIPFYKLQPTTYFLQNESTAALYTITKNLVTYNFFGVLCLILALAALVLYVWNGSEKITMAAIAVSVVDLISLFLALIVGNSDIKDVKSLINALVQYSGTSANANLFLKSSVAAGFVLELLMILVMIGSYWINELVIKPYVFSDKSGAKLNPFEGLTGTAKARTQAVAPQGYVQQPMQGQTFGQAPQQPVQGQTFGQAPQQPVQNQNNNVQ